MYVLGFSTSVGKSGLALMLTKLSTSGQRRRSILLSIVSPFLFGAYIHAQGLNAICVDQLVKHILWKRFIDKLMSEWGDLHPTLILNASITSLAVPNGNPTTRISSNLSIINSVSVVILGLLPRTLQMMP
ncbi:hypothetical protein BDR03DRAFT_376155 [Suillus americanus]|nr:hypothetical protein BDR03DRAFT_376155 [Suillus americanus]